MIVSISANLGCEPLLLKPAICSLKSSRILQLQHKQHCGQSRSRLSLCCSAAGTAFGEDALSASFEEFILDTQHAIIQVSIPAYDALSGI